LKKGVQTAICCPCGNEKILALGLCATCYTLKRQDAEYFGGLREQVLERDDAVLLHHSRRWFPGRFLDWKLPEKAIAAPSPGRSPIYDCRSLIYLKVC